MATVTKKQGESISISGTVKNTGNVSIGSLNLEVCLDSTSLGSLSIGSLGVGSETNFSGSVKVPTNMSPATYNVTINAYDGSTKFQSGISTGWQCQVQAALTLYGVSVDKSTLKSGEKYTLTIYYEVPAGTYYVYLDGTSIASFSTSGESGSRSYTLTAPSSAGTYTFNVKLKRAYTGEESETKSYTITVIYSGSLSNLRDYYDTSLGVRRYFWDINIDSGPGTWKTRFMGKYTDQTWDVSVSSVPYSTTFEARESVTSTGWTWIVKLYAPDGTEKDSKSDTAG